MAVPSLGATLVTVCLVATAAASSCPYVDPDDRQDCYPFGDVNQAKCEAHGCCYNEVEVGKPWCYHPPKIPPPAETCSRLSAASRIDCFPELFPNEEQCQARGCCWLEDGDNGVPFCFRPQRAQYEISRTYGNATYSNSTLDLMSGTEGPYGASLDIPTLRLEVWQQTQQRLRFRLIDASAARYEVPGVVVVSPGPGTTLADYHVQLLRKPFAIVVTRRTTGEVLFNSTTPTELSTLPFQGLTFSEQYLEMSTNLAPEAALSLYGLGEHVAPFRISRNTSTGNMFTIMARDRGTPQHSALGNTNLYGSHSFYMGLYHKTGNAHGVFLLNSNGMDVVVQSNALTYRVIGGILDFYLFTGPSMHAVVQQYTDVIGKPYMPPYWALGFHLCRWGYGSLNATKAVVQGMKDHNMPQDVQWNDIDYMDRYLDFTVDPINYPLDEFQDFVHSLHEEGKHYMMIFDPGIANFVDDYPPYERGLDMNVFINDTNGSPIVGKVWPGKTVFPDFFHPNATKYWTEQVSRFHNSLPFDGMWIDMNEPDNFCSGYCKDEAAAHSQSSAGDGYSLRGSNRNAVVPFDADNPPYIPGHRGGAVLFYMSTLSFTARQWPSIHYNVHSMYGWSETRASMTAMKEARGKRTLVLSRSTFPGTGAHGAHWLGDNTATWDDIYFSIPGILMMNLFGIPFVGPDTCGFNGETTAELCTRWMQLGAFYPFYRNHNSVDMSPQEPYVFGEPYTSIIRAAMETRYTLLPYLYTLLHATHVEGTPMARSIISEFPTEGLPAAGIDQQYLLGPALLVSPVLEEGATTVDAYFPDAMWYAWYDNAKPIDGDKSYRTLDAPLSTIHVHVRGGHVVPTQGHAMTSTAARSNPFNLTVALSKATNGDQMASGELFLDDGDSLDTYENGEYSYVKFIAKTFNNGGHGQIKGSVIHSSFQPPPTAILATVRILGVNSKPTGTITLNGKRVDWSYDAEHMGLLITGLQHSMLDAFSMSW